jgi:catechol 2,3-dioxygenase-like lactoylglutathione lyase family enzyme
MQALRIWELNHVAVHVRDLEASMRFYGEVLGLPPIDRPDFGFPGAWYALGDQELHLIHDADYTPAARTGSHFALLVESTAAAHEELTARGLSGIQAPAPRPDGAVQIFFRDPDGHLIEMVSAGR